MFAYCGNNPVNCVDPTGTYHYVMGVDNTNPLAFAQHNYLGGGMTCGGRSITSSDIGENDGPSAIYDSKDRNPNDPVRVQLGTFDWSALSFSNDEIVIISAEAALLSYGLEFRDVDLSLLDFGVAEINASCNRSGVELCAMASIWSPSAAFEIGGATITISGYAGGVGGVFIFKTNKIEIGGSAPFGASISIEW